MKALSLQALRIVVLLALVVPPLFSQEKSKITGHPFFKHLAGEWKTEGELKSETNDNTVKIKEEWAGKVSDEGEFIIEGTRVTNDSEPQKFRWTITHNLTTDLYEAVQVNPDDAANAIRFEGTIMESPLALELRAQFGNGGGSATVTDTFTAEDHSILTTKVVLLNDAGGTNLEGTLTSKRVKKP